MIVDNEHLRDMSVERIRAAMQKMHSEIYNRALRPPPPPPPSPQKTVEETVSSLVKVIEWSQGEPNGSRGVSHHGLPVVRNCASDGIPYGATWDVSDNRGLLMFIVRFGTPPPLPNELVTCGGCGRQVRDPYVNCKFDRALARSYVSDIIGLCHVSAVDAWDHDHGVSVRTRIDVPRLHAAARTELPLRLVDFPIDMADR